MSAPFQLTPRRALNPVKLLTLGASLVLILFLSTVGWADSCSTVSLSLGGPPVVCTLPEQTPELSVNATLSSLSFTDQAQGMVLIYDDSTHTLLSDVVVFANVNGVATVTFLSDTDLIPVTASGLPVLGQFTESNNPIFVSVALGNGNFLRAKICSDVNETTGCSGSSDSISLSESTSVVPEPGTFILFGSGLLGSGALKLSSWRRQKRMQS